MSKPCGSAKCGQKGGCGKLINMLNGSDQTELAFAAVQTRRRTSDHGAEAIFWQNPNPARADARLLPGAADVAVARPRSRDAAFPRLAAPSWPDRTAMADLAGAGFGRRHRSHGARALRLAAGPEPFPDSARSRGASPSRAPDRESRSAPRPGVDFGRGRQADGDRSTLIGSDLRRD